MEIGVRELKAKLSEHLSLAARGQRIIVTDRGRPIAELTPLAGSSALERGIDEGWVEAPRSVRLQPARPVAANASVMDVLDEDRG